MGLWDKAKSIGKMDVKELWGMLRHRKVDATGRPLLDSPPILSPAVAFWVVLLSPLILFQIVLLFLPSRAGQYSAPLRALSFAPSHESHFAFLGSTSSLNLDEGGFDVSNLSFVGTVYHTAESKKSALILSKQGEPALLILHEGDKVNGDITVMRINRTNATLARGRQTITIGFTAENRSVIELPKRGKTTQSGGGDKVSESPQVVLAKILRDPSLLSQYMDYTLIRKGRQIKGARIHPKSPALTSLGFMDDDIIRGVNGHALGDFFTGKVSFQKMVDADSSFRFELERGGGLTNIVVSK